MAARVEGENAVIWPPWSIRQQVLRLHGLEEQHLNSLKGCEAAFGNSKASPRLYLSNLLARPSDGH